ncbi:MAG: DegT/DnrJ/EryC1/StrS family aminotransferase [Anaerolineales bacterium]
MTLTIPMLNLKAQYAAHKAEIDAAIARVLESQHFILGEEVETLEANIAAYSQCKHGIGVSSGTDALLVALMAINLRPGDEVITTSYSFFATAGAIARLGATPVFVDIDPQTLNLNPAAIETAITPRTRAILPVHLAGQVTEMQPILQLAAQHNLYIIEDACQAIGADWQGKRAGSIGHLGCFSFFPSKNLGGAGDSGMVVCNDDALADRVRLLRNHGHRPKYYNKAIGGNFRMDALQAAILNAKFPHLETWTHARIQNAAEYRRLFAARGLAIPLEELHSGAGVVLPTETGSGRHIYHLFVLWTAQRDALMAHLKARGVASEVYYPVPLHRQECFEYLGYTQGSLPHSEAAAQHSLALPIYPELTPEQQAYIVDCIAEFFE